VLGSRRNSLLIFDQNEDDDLLSKKILSRMKMHKIKKEYSSFFWMALFAVSMLVLLNFTLINNLVQINFLDPFFYTSYAHNYSDLIERYGRTYYSTRLAFIYPARFFIWIFGSEAGYLVFRSLLLFGAIAATWRICISFYNSKKIAAFVSFLLVLHPWFIRSICWDYIDGVAIVYTLLSVSFFILAEGVDRTSYFLSGIFFLLAVNCNVFVGGLFSAFLPFWYILRKSSPLSLFWKNALFFFFGMGSIYLLFIGLTYWEFPTMNPFFDRVTISMSKWMVTGGGSGWKQSINAVLSHGEYYIFYPLLVLSLCSLFWIFNKKDQLLNPRFGISAILCLFITLCLFVFVQFVLKVYVICYCYYFDYAIPATLLALIWLTGEFFHSLESKNKIRVLIVTSLVYALVWISASFWIKYIKLISGLTLSVAAMIFLSLFAVFSVFNFQKLKACAIILALVFSTLVFYKSPNYSIIHASQSSRKEWDLYHGSIHLQKTISSKLDPKAGKVGFWYSTKPEVNFFNSMQSMFLYGPSRLSNMEEGSLGMPFIDETFKKTINNYRYIALLALTQDEIADACKSLEDEGIQTTELFKSNYNSEKINYHLLVLEKMPRG
jgi:hypothetical protein